MLGRKKVLLIISLSLLVGLLGCYVLYNILGKVGAGSYCNAEIFELNSSEENVIDAINKFKSDNPEYVTPDITINNQRKGNLSESEGRKDNSHWYMVYFYYKDKNQIVFTWTRPSFEDNKTDFAFVGLNDGLDLGHWKDINKDFGFTENRIVKKEFEERILNKIKANLLNK